MSLPSSNWKREWPSRSYGTLKTFTFLTFDSLINETLTDPNAVAFAGKTPFQVRPFGAYPEERVPDVASTAGSVVDRIVSW